MGAVSSTLRKRSASIFEESSEAKRARLDTSSPSLQDVARTEMDAGITAFANPHLAGFRGIIKNRYDDFLVNEVDLDGKVIRLTSLNADSITKKDKTLSLNAEEFDARITELFGADNASKVRALLESGSQNKELQVEIDTTREQRAKFYNLLDEHVEEKPVVLIKDGKMTLRWARDDEELARESPPNWQKLGGEYLQFHALNYGIDTMQITRLISKYTKYKASDICFAGNKDARAVTVQALTIHKGRYKRLLAAQEQLKQHNIYLGDFEYVSSGLKLGDLGGNRFSIVLRDVQGTSEEEISKSVQSLKDNGFINYFGMQRFGTGTIMSHEVGRAILKRDYQEAVNLILKPRPGDRVDYAAARQYYENTKDAAGAYSKFPPNAAAERSAMKTYERSPDNHARVIANLPMSLKTMYLHAYQSYIWNRVVSERIKRFGCKKPLVGDLVLLKDVPDPAAEPVELNNAGRRNPFQRKKVKILTQKDIDSGEHTINDVVYPLPGYSIDYPQNEIGELYQQLLDQDNIKITKKGQDMKKLRGDYRLMLAVPKDVSWSFIRYDDPNVRLFNTDLDYINGEPEPSDTPGGKHLALRVQFTLGSSQYATMALREIMRQGTSSAEQAKLVHA
ncbi:hypothetical protein VTP01DRAFT_4473 [Rhizomucor pusillus]|uniref:uncharacterized protein n=1 Tax=Rhizomucor pusillus TaxID=4840 RepID=UPI0037439E1E